MGYQSVVVTKDAPISVASEPELDLHVDLMADAHLGNFTDTIYEPVTKTVFMRPRQFESGWTPSSVVSFTPSDPTNWEAIAVGAATNLYMMSKNATTTAPASTSQSANQPFVCSFFVYGQSGAVGTYKALQLTFGGLTMDIYSNGLCVIGTQRGYLTAGYQQGQAGFGNICNRWVRLLIMPINRTGVLFYSDLGGAWIYNAYADVSSTSNTLLSAAAFTFSAPTSKALFQLQHAVFKTTGYYTTRVYDLNYSPGTGRTVTPTAKYDAPTGSSVSISMVDSGGSAFVPDGVKHEVAAYVSFTSDGTVTPLLYAADCNIDGVRITRSTPTPAVIAVHGVGGIYNVPVTEDQHKRLMAWESVSPVTGVHSYSALDGSGNEVFVIPAAMPDQDQSSNNVTAEQLQSLLKKAKFFSSWRMDCMNDTDVIAKCLRVAGIEDARMVLDTATAMPGDPRGKLSTLVVPAGTSVIDAIQMLLKLRPAHELTLELSSGSVVLHYGIPPSSGSSPVVTLYADDLHSQNVGGTWIPGSVFQYQPLANIKYCNRAGDGQPWNAVMVVGRTVDGVAITSSVEDADAMDPLTPTEITSTGCHWTGARVAYVYRDSRLCTQDQCDDMRDWLWAQYCLVRKVVEFEGVMHNQLCHNSVVELVDDVESGSELYRIIKIEPVSGLDYTETEYGAVRYTAELLPELPS